MFIFPASWAELPWKTGHTSGIERALMLLIDSRQAQTGLGAVHVPKQLGLHKTGELRGRRRVSGRRAYKDAVACGKRCFSRLSFSWLKLFCRLSFFFIGVALVLAFLLSYLQKNEWSSSDIVNDLELSYFGGLRKKYNIRLWQLAMNAACTSSSGLEITVCAFLTIEGKLFGRNEWLTICMGVNVPGRRVTKKETS